MENDKERTHLHQTEVLQSIECATKFKIAIDLLNEIEIDGETAEYLLDELQMKEQVFGQMLRNKIYSKSFKTASDIISEYL